jgi:hypothetical protein
MGGLVGLAALGVAAWALGLVWPGLGLAGTGAAALLVLWGLHRLLLWAEGRGWIYYRKKRGSHGGLGATAEFLNMYYPSRKHIQEVARESEWKREEDDDGDRPES